MIYNNFKMQLLLGMEGRRKEIGVGRRFNNTDFCNRYTSKANMKVCSGGCLKPRFLIKHFLFV